MTSIVDKCFACGRPLANPHRVTCADDQQPFVGQECFRKIRKAGAIGWQPKRGPRLYLIEHKPLPTQDGRNA